MSNLWKEKASLAPKGIEHYQMNSLGKFKNY